MTGDDKSRDTLQVLINVTQTQTSYLLLNLLTLRESVRRQHILRQLLNRALTLMSMSIKPVLCHDDHLIRKAPIPLTFAFSVSRLRVEI